MPAAPPLTALPTLKGDGVIARPITRSDLAAIHALFSDPEVVRFMSVRLLTSERDAERMLLDLERSFGEGSLYSWGIALEEAPLALAGTCTLASIDRANERAELGFALLPAMRKKGILTRAAKLVLAFAFEGLGLRRVEADTDPRNVASIALLERLGFAREGHQRERYIQLGEVQDALMFGLLRRDWQARKDRAMDAPAGWRDLIERLLTEETRVPVSYGDITLYTVFDRAQDHYLLMAVGWDGHKRVHAPLIHVDIVDGKLWIQHDGTEKGIALDLEAGGVPKDRIVLAFQHMSRRKYGDYAAA